MANASETQADKPDFPRAYDIAALQQRRHLWTARLLGLAFALSMFMNIAVVWLLIALFPLKEVRPFLVQLAEDKTILTTIKPIPEALDSLDVLTEKLVAEYVRTRHEIVRSDAIMQERWGRTGYLGLMTARKEYDRFSGSIEPVIKELRKNDVTQEVSIVVVSTLKKRSSTAPGLYQVEFDTIGRGANGSVIARRRWVATLELAFRPLTDVPYGQRMINPTGFTVLSYTLAEKASK